MRILIAEDQKELNEVLTKTLIRNHYTVDSCRNGTEAAACLEMTGYDAVILDIMMPGRDGLQVLRDLRRAGNTTPVLLLTARDSIEDRVRGLDAGADDYLIKPFAIEELLARIRVMLRTREGRALNQIQAGDLFIDCDTRAVTRAGQPISLSSREFSILEYMASNQGIVLSREKIEQHIWNFDYEGGSNVVDVYIRYLRRKIDDPFETRLIHTVRGAGYVLRAPEKGKTE